MHYQPVIDLTTEQPARIEALVRWQRPGQQPRAAADFLPEDGVVIDGLCAFVLDAACSAGAADGWEVSVNVSAAEVCRWPFLEHVLDTCARHDMSPRQLTLELTQAEGTLGHPIGRRVLERLVAHGLRVSVDGFGTTSAPLTCLRDPLVSELKLAADAPETSGRAAEPVIVSNVARLAEELDLRLVATRIELPAQAAALVEAGCPLGQGNLWGSPRAYEELQVRPAGSAPTLHERILSLLQIEASPVTIAAALNTAGERTPHGVRWHRTSVERYLRERGLRPGGASAVDNA